MVVAGFAFHGRAAAPTAAADIQAQAVTTLPTSGSPELDKMILEAGARHGVDPKLVYYVIRQESNFKTAARSHKNAQGLMQMIPATAERFGVKDVYDPEQNIEGGTKYLRWLLKRFNGNVKLALAGYNAGEGAVEKSGNQVPDYTETKNYVKKIVENYGKTHHPVLDPAQAAEKFKYAAAASEAL
ncbi:MAG TPA: lytic transglycosylase domain-containing protein [Blastocatellia bacterium]|nr:lytic transglycosylase domain-containing protein [Blastocatellia bacterium]